MNQLNNYQNQINKQMKTSYLKISLTLLAFVAMLGVVHGQDALWQLDFEKEIVFNQNTDTGILLG